MNHEEEEVLFILRTLLLISNSPEYFRIRWIKNYRGINTSAYYYTTLPVVHNRAGSKTNKYSSWLSLT